MAVGCRKVNQTDLNMEELVVYQILLEFCSYPASGSAVF